MNSRNIGRQAGLAASILIGLLGLASAPCDISAAESPTAQPKRYEQYTPAELAAAASGLRDAGISKRDEFEALLEYFGEACRAAVAGGDVQSKLRHWLPVIVAVGRNLPEAVRGGIIADVEKGIPTTHEANIALSSEDVSMFSAALGALGSREASRTMALDWINGSEKYRTAPLHHLAALLPQMEGVPKEVAAERVSAHSRLADRVHVEVFADSSALRKHPDEIWCAFALRLSYSISEGRRLSWVSALRHAFAADPQQIQKLDGTRMWLLGRSLVALRDDQWWPLLVEWMKTGDQWQSIPPYQMVWMAKQLVRSSDCGRAQLERMLGYFSQKLLVNAATARLMDTGIWRDMSSIAAKILTPAQKAQWAARLEQVFLGDPQGLAFLGSRGDFSALLDARSSLGGGNVAAATAALFAEKSSQWQSWAPADLDWLIGKLQGSEAQRRSLTDSMMARLLAARKTAGSTYPEDWQRVAVLVRPGLPSEQCSALLEGMMTAFFGDSGGFQALDSKELERLVKAMNVLGAKNAEALPLKFVLERPVWRTWDANQIYDLSGAIAGGKSDKGLKARTILSSHIQAAFLVSESKTRAFSCSRWKAIAQRLGPCLAADVRADWAEKIRKAFTSDHVVLSSLAKNQVVDLTDALQTLGSPKAGTIVLSWMSSRSKRP